MNEIKVSENVSIYINDIWILCDEYINSLDNPDMIYKSSIFRGMLDYIYRHGLKDISLYNPKKNSSLDYELLDKIFFEIYLPIVYKYNAIPSILGFSTMLRIDSENLSYVRKGVYYDGSRANPKNSEIVKKWYAVSESSLYDKAVQENGIGAIFGLKAGFGWKEAVASPEPYTTPTIDSPETIAERHKQNVLTMPEKPTLD